MPSKKRLDREKELVSYWIRDYINVVRELERGEYACFLSEAASDCPVSDDDPICVLCRELSAPFVVEKPEEEEALEVLCEVRIRSAQRLHDSWADIQSSFLLRKRRAFEVAKALVTILECYEVRVSACDYSFSMDIIGRAHPQYEGLED